MRRHGHRAIFYARFVAGLRALVYLTAGSLGVSPLRFFLYDLAGAVISVPVVVTLGYFFGNELEAALRYIGGVEKAVWLLAALSLGVYAMRMLMFTREREESQT
jgi:membrane protein DedA with SNARE-associated domain